MFFALKGRDVAWNFSLVSHIFTSSIWLLTILLCRETIDYRKNYSRRETFVYSFILWLLQNYDNLFLHVLMNETYIYIYIYNDDGRLSKQGSTIAGCLMHDYKIWRLWFWCWCWWKWMQQSCRNKCFSGQQFQYGFLSFTSLTYYTRGKQNQMLLLYLSTSSVQERTHTKKKKKWINFWFTYHGIPGVGVGVVWLRRTNEPVQGWQWWVQPRRIVQQQRFFRSFAGGRELILEEIHKKKRRRKSL